MIRKCLLLSLIYISSSAPYIDYVSPYDWKPRITERDLAITPHHWETCYQYAERKVNEMKRKYANRRIVGSDWLSAYWAHHYEGALIYRNYFWKPV